MSKTLCKEHTERIKKMTFLNYGHIAGGVVREFLKEVIPIIENRVQAKVQPNQNLLGLFRTLRFKKESLSAKLLVN